MKLREEGGSAGRAVAVPNETRTKFEVNEVSIDQMAEHCKAIVVHQSFRPRF